MAQHNITGTYGEHLAKQYLIEHGYAIMETNWHHGKHEIDIIAHTEGVIVFVEVKTRSSYDFGTPQEAVDRKRRRAYISLANNYLTSNNRSEEARFDIIAIVANEHGYDLNHIENAFSVIDYM